MRRRLTNLKNIYPRLVEAQTGATVFDGRLLTHSGTRLSWGEYNPKLRGKFYKIDTRCLPDKRTPLQILNDIRITGVMVLKS